MSGAPFRIRIGMVKLKNGATIHVLRTRAEKKRAYVETEVRQTLDAQGADIDGFAFVVWGKDLTSTVAFHGGSVMPNAVVPEFLKTRLVAEYANWSAQYRMDAAPEDDAS